MFGPDFPYAVRRLPRPPGGARPDTGDRARHRGRGHRRRPVRHRGRVRADEDGPASPSSTRPTRSAAGCGPWASTGCDRALTAEMGAMRFPPSSTALQHYIDLVGLETSPFPNPLAAGDPVDRRRPQGRVALRRDARRPAAGLPGRRRRLERRCLEEGADFSDMNRAMRERDVPRIREIWAQAGREARQPDLLRLPLRLRGLRVLPAPRDLRPGRLRHRRLGHRLPQLHPGDPARRLHRGRRPPPRHRRRLPAAAAAAVGARAGRRSSTGRTAPRWRRCTRTASRARP